jgi:predicted phage terminase large subunit-like protein
MSSLKLSQQGAAWELLRRRKARQSLIEYARYIEVPGAPASEDEETESFKPVETVLAQHHLLILDALQRCIERDHGRLMIFMPPGSAKSTYASVVAPSWAMGRKPGFKVIGVSYGSDMAKKFGRRTRSIIRQQKYQALFGTGLSADQAAADEWALESGSEYMSGGILSGITGNRADFVSIDDPVKGRQDADSEVVRQRTWDEYQESVLTRLKPRGSLAMILTRWHEDDPAGRILPDGYNGESGMIMGKDGFEWEVLCLQAECERLDDPLGRKIGDMIWPEWFDEKHWANFRKNVRTWSALFQQRPAPDTGDYFKREWVHEVDHLPPIETMSIYGASDYAVTADGGDYTAHVVVGIDPENKVYLLDLWRYQASSDVWVNSFCDLVLKWRPIAWAEETGQIKSGVGPFLVRSMIEKQAYVVREQFPTRGGDKAVRAQSFRGRIATMGLYIHRDAPWKTDLISEMMSFPVGVHDDQVDALGLVGQLMDRMFAGTSKKPEPEPIPPEHIGKLQVPAYNQRRKKGPRRV